MKKILFFLLAIIFAIQGYSQSIFVAANGTATNNYLPVYGFYMDDNQHSQFIYPASEVGALNGALISKIKFHTSSTSYNSDWGTATCTISIGVPTETSFASAAFNPTPLTQVYSGSIAVVNGIMEFTFTTPYLFPGGNMLIDITTITSGDYLTATFSGITATNGGYYLYSYGGGIQQFLPKATFEYTGGSPVVITSAPSSVNTTSATLQGIYFNLTSTNYGFQYMLETVTDWSTASIVTATTNPMSEIVTSLTPNTSYKYRAFANDGTNVIYGDEKTFTTLALPATLPYACDFENPTENAQWAFINGTQTNQWVIGNASYNPAVNNTVSGENALYISNDPLGAVWTYSGTGSATNSWVYAYRDFEVPAGVTDLKLDFDWIAKGGVPKSEFLRVYWMPTDIPITAGNLPPTVNSVNYDLTAQIGNYTNGYGEHWLSNQSTWQHSQFVINTTQFPTLAGTTWRLYVHWRNNQSAAVQPPATFDNMSLVISNCTMPRLDSVVNITQNAADIYFTENGTASAWNIEYRILGTNQWTPVVVTANPFNLPGLQPSTAYEIRLQSDCLSEQSGWSPIKKFNTACGVITQIPWQFGFEDLFGTNSSIGSTGVSAPLCWININGGYFSTYSSYYWTRTTSPVRTGVGALQFYGGWTTSSSYLHNDWLISPPITLTRNERLTFYVNSAAPSTYMDDISLYVYSFSDNQLLDITSANDTTLFDLVIPSTVVTATGTNWQRFEVNLSSYTGDVRFALVRNFRPGGQYLYIDDIKIDPLPTCVKPDSVTVTNITAYGAEFNWNLGNPNNTTFWIYFKPVTSNIWDSVQVTGTNQVLSTLLPSTNYQYYLKTDCGNEFSEPTDVNTFMTSCVPVSSLPWNEGFEGLTAATTLPPCWAATGFGTYTNTQIIDAGYSNRNARTGTAAAYFRYSCNDRFFTSGFQLTAGVAYKFSYWFVTDGISGWTTLQAGAYSAQNAGSLIQTMNTLNGPTNETYQEVVSYFTPTSDGVYYFGIYCQAEFAPNYLTIDDISLDIAPDCLPVQQLAVSNIGGTSAFVSWIPAGTPDYYTVAISPAGQDNWTTNTTTGNNFILTGLSELTAYDVQVYPFCSGVDGAADTVTFTTICGAGGDLIIGTPDAATSTNGNYLPSQLYYNYSYTQQIFDASELGTLDSIHTISFQYFPSASSTRLLTIYLAHTTQTTFSSTSNFIPLDSLTQVFQGSVAFNNSGPNNWFTISLPIGFEYDGVSNLVLAVQDNTDSYTNSAEKFKTHSVTGNKSVYYYMDDQIINPNNPTLDPTGNSLSLGAINYRNNVKFSLPCDVVTCYAPNVILTNITSSSATMAIVPGASETSWEGEYKAASDPTWTTLGTNVTSPYLLPALNSNTTYSVRFRTVCSASDVSTWKSVTFTTDCGTIETLPFVENFDTYTANSSNIPTCWNKVTTNGSYPYIYGYNALSTPNALYFYSSSTTYATIVLPPVDASIPLNTLQLTLWGRNYSAGQNVKIGVMTNPNDAATFTLIGTFTPTAAGTYEEYIVSFANYTDTGVYIAIKSDNIAQSLSNEFYIDNLSLDLIPSCSKPLDIVFSTITTTEATASWDASPTALSYEVVYGLPGVDPATATPIPVTDTFFEMTPLTATTLYHFFVRSVCSGGEFSEWTSLRTFSTVALAPVPYTEGFSSTSIPVGYNLTRFSVGSLTYVPGNPANNLYANLYSSYPTGVISTINIGPLLPNYELAFEYKLATYGAGDIVPTGTGNFIVAISTDWGTTYTNVDTVDNNGIAGYQNYSFNLSAYDTQIIKIKITGNWISNDYYLGIDNIYVGPTITCPFPTLPTSANSTQTSVDLSWTENGTATAWQVEYGPIGFTQGTGTFVSATTNTAFTISGLTATTCYDAYIRAVCGAADSSNWSSKITFCTAQIPAQVPVTFDFETPSGFQFANISTGNNWNIGAAVNNTTGGQNAMYISNNNGVANAYNQDLQAVVWAYRDIQFPTSTADFTLTFDWKSKGETGWDYMNVYIGTPTTPQAISTDYNIIVPAGATSIATLLQDSTNWQTATYTLPAATNSGLVKRLYFVWRNDTNTGVNPPAAVDNITITTSTPVCAVPTNLAVNGVTSSTGTATWTAGGTETQWEIAYKPTASATWMTAFVSPVATYNLPSLLAATPYDVKVRAICGVGDTSAYTAIFNFTTLATSCPAPTNLAATAITTTGATITWTPGGSETAWELDYKMASASTWTTVNTTAPSHNLTTLTPSTAYNVRVRAICGAGNNSDYTVVVNFTTATPPCLMPTNVLVPSATITDQSAVVSWTAAAGQTQWQVEYKLVSSANWTTMPISTATTQPIVALQSNSTYEVRVKAICSATNESPFTTPVQFTTTGAVTYIITATASGPGTINPTGSVVVNAGANQTFTFTPTGNAHVVSLLVDNLSATYSNNEYTFSNVLANHTISVNFAEAIDENGLAKLVELYPNPTNATIEIRLNETQLQVKECRVYDIYGKLMSIVPVNADNTKIDVTDFAAGVYFIRMNSEMGVITKKFVKK